MYMYSHKNSSTKIQKLIGVGTLQQTQGLTTASSNYVLVKLKSHS